MLKYFSGLIERVRYGQAHREARPIMAQALYEPLSSEDEARLKNLFSSFKKLECEYESLQKTREAIQLPTDAWAGDLLPAIKQQLAEERVPQVRRKRMGAYALAFSLVAVFSIALYGIFMLAAPNGAMVNPAEQFASKAGETQLSLLSQEACDMVALGESEIAAELLAQAIQSYPDDAYHADALLTLADIEYTYLRRYERAYETLKILERDHRDIFNRNWDYDKRVRLLSAALPDAFSPIRDLEAAAHADNPLQEYEHVLVEYPDKVWAEEALYSMKRLIARNTNTDPADTLQVLQRIRNACTHPVALARIDLELGNYYCDSLDDLDLAREHFAQAAASRHIALTAKAQEALARLD